MDPRLEPVYADVVRRNPSEPEFHQAVLEVFDSLGPVLDRHPEYTEEAVLARLCEPERQVIFRVPWVDDAGRVQVNRGFRVSSTPRSAPTRADCASTPASTPVSSSSWGSSRSSRTP